MYNDQIDIQEPVTVIVKSWDVISNKSIT